VSAPIGPGDWVECVSDDAKPMVRGRIYQVARAHRTDAACTTCGDADGAALEIVGHPHPLGWGFCIGCEVRPIYRPRSDFIESLKQPAPPAVRELEPT
jgi:hypothetical protein